MDRETEADAHFIQTLRLDIGTSVDIDPEGLKRFGGTPSRSGSVPMLRHRHSTGRRDDRRGRGDIPCLGSASGSRCIKYLVNRNRGFDSRDMPSHDLRRPHQFITGGLSPGKESQQRPHLAMVHPSGHHRFEGVGGGLTTQCAAPDQGTELIRQIDLRVVLVEFGG